MITSDSFHGPALIYRSLVFSTRYCPPYTNIPNRSIGIVVHNTTLRMFKVPEPSTDEQVLVKMGYGKAVLITLSLPGREFCALLIGDYHRCLQFFFNPRHHSTKY